MVSGALLLALVQVTALQSIGLELVRLDVLGALPIRRMGRWCGDRRGWSPESTELHVFRPIPPGTA